MMNAIAELRQMMEDFSNYAQSGASDGGMKIINALLGVLARLLHRAIVTRNVVKVLMTVGIQKDDVSPEEIKRQLIGHIETGVRKSRDLMRPEGELHHPRIVSYGLARKVRPRESHRRQQQRHGDGSRQPRIAD